MTARSGNGFQPANNILDARQRWLFRMVHTKRPLQEKMALFWHNHFATAYSKINGEIGDGAFATRMLAAKPDEDPSRAKGQIELFREHALGNFRDLLVEVAQDPAMLVWLDGRTNVRARPQENFARELMELFTLGVGHFDETDVYAGARVFTGWNLAWRTARPRRRATSSSTTRRSTTRGQGFYFSDLCRGRRTIAGARGRRGHAGRHRFHRRRRRASRDRAAAGAQAVRLLRQRSRCAGRFGLIDALARVYYSSNYEIEPMVQTLLLSPQFQDPSNYYKRYSWPVEFVVRALKEVGWNGFSVNSALSPLISMGQQLFEPPDVNGWELGPGWFSSGGMLARMNFAATLATNQRFNLRDQSRGKVDSPKAWCRSCSIG